MPATALPRHPEYLKVLSPALGEGNQQLGPQNGKASAFPTLRRSCPQCHIPMVKIDTGFRCHRCGHFDHPGMEES